MAPSKTRRVNSLHFELERAVRANSVFANRRRTRQPLDRSSTRVRIALRASERERLRSLTISPRERRAPLVEISAHRNLYRDLYACRDTLDPKRVDYLVGVDFNDSLNLSSSISKECSTHTHAHTPTHEQKSIFPCDTSGIVRTERRKINGTAVADKPSSVAARETERRREERHTNTHTPLIIPHVSGINYAAIDFADRE